VSGDTRALTLGPYGFRWFLLEGVGGDGGAATGSRPRRARASRWTGASPAPALEEQHPGRRVEELERTPPV